MVAYVKLIDNFLTKIAINKHTYHLTHMHYRLAVIIATAKLKESKRKCVRHIPGETMSSPSANRERYLSPLPHPQCMCRSGHDVTSYEKAAIKPKQSGEEGRELGVLDGRYAY